MSKHILEKIDEAISDITVRLNTIGPPGYIASDGSFEAELLPSFFEDMPQYEREIFPENLQQCIAASAHTPLIGLNQGGANNRKPHYEILNSIVNKSIPEAAWADFRNSCHISVRLGLNFLFHSTPSVSSGVWQRVENGYANLLNKLGLESLELPSSFNSLQLYTFFKSQKQVQDAVLTSNESLRSRIHHEIDILSDQQKTEESVVEVVHRHTGLLPTGQALYQLVEFWGLRQQIGIFANESDKRIADVFLEVIAEHGHRRPSEIANIMDKTCFDRGIPGIETPGRVSREMRRIFRDYYVELMSRGEGERPGSSRRLRQPVIARPEDITASDSRHADVRDVIREATLGTGERSTSSLRHSRPYNNPVVRSRIREPKDPT